MKESQTKVQPIDTPPSEAHEFAGRADVQGLLFQYTDKLYRAHSLGQIYDAALDAICRGLGTERASILRFDDAGVIRFVASRGLSENYRKAVEGHSPWSPGDRDTQPICVEDINATTEPDAIKTAIHREGICGLAFIPLAIDDQVIGKFMVYYDTPRLFTDQERELALILARQLGFAIERNKGDGFARRLAAIVNSSQDAIISKSLDGVIHSWNGGAERLFGYTASEAIGCNVTMLIPEERHDEEPSIIARIRAGERIESYETVRVCKDGRQVDISLTVSPIRDADGVVIGASKIARDITDKRRAVEQQTLLLREMGHRIKNLFTLASSLLRLSVKSARTPDELASTVSDRLGALARAHALTVSPTVLDETTQQAATLHEVIKAILAPFNHRSDADRPRISVSGDDIAIAGSTATPLALLFYELATNASKYGGLSSPTGHVEVTSAIEGEQVILIWRESGGPVVEPATTRGFGSTIVEAAASQLGEVSRDWAPDGLVARVVLKRP